MFNLLPKFPQIVKSRYHAHFSIINHLQQCGSTSSSTLYSYRRTFLVYVAPGHAPCFTVGPTVDINKDGVLRATTAMCQMLAGRYESQEQRRFCAYGTDVVKWDFNVKNTQSSTATLPPGDCKAQMEAQINGCDIGGRVEAKGWEYT